MLCRYSASAQDVANGVVRMSRKVTNSGVKSYAHHMPKDEIMLTKKENMVYKRGVLTKAQGKTDCKLMEKVCVKLYYFFKNT